jgi:hypothetical protein
VIAVAVRALGTLPILELNMKKIILFACLITLLTTTGCFFPGRGWGWRGRRGEVAVPTPVVVVAAPRVVVPPPVVVAPPVEVVPALIIDPVPAVIIP